MQFAFGLLARSRRPARQQDLPAGAGLAHRVGKLAADQTDPPGDARQPLAIGAGRAAGDRFRPRPIVFEPETDAVALEPCVEQDGRQPYDPKIRLGFADP